MSDEALANTTTVVADIGATFVRAALGRGAALGPVTERRVAELQRGTDDGIVPGAVELMREAITAGFDGTPALVAAAGIGVCAAVDESGSLHRSLPFGVPSGRRVVEIAGAGLGVPVAIDNDANMAALGELHYGAGRGLRDFILITLGTNIGMGIVAGGHVFRGTHGGAGEGGMMLVPVRSLDQPANEGGRRVIDAGRFGVHASHAPDGYAWIEELVGGGALARALAERRAIANAGTERRKEPVRTLAEATAGDPDATTVVDRAIEGWAYAIANYVALLDPAAVVLSGGLTEDIGPFLERLRKRVAVLSRAEPQILMAELGSVGGLMGASAAAIAISRATVDQQSTSPSRDL